MSTWVTPVTDRTQEDVDYALEMIAGGTYQSLISTSAYAYAGDAYAATTSYLEGVLCNLKGCLNKSDLKRICGNFDHLFERYGIDMEAPDVPDIPAEDFFETLEECEEIIYEAAGIDVEPALHPFNTYELVNQLESLQLAAYEMLNTKVQPVAGDDVYAGDDSTTILI